ncbi:MAG: hypothetical protein HYT10_02225 [Candidatus Levybacteria bacterium]|nr:hypothetical protein [Candidatus Levybacteria bacterium]
MDKIRSTAPWALAISFLSTFVFGLVALRATTIEDQLRLVAGLTAVVLIFSTPGLLVSLLEFRNQEIPSFVFGVLVIGAIFGLGWFTYQTLAGIAGQMEVIYRSPVSAFYLALSMSGLWTTTTINIITQGHIRGPVLSPILLGSPMFFGTTLLLGLRFI